MMNRCIRRGASFVIGALIFFAHGAPVHAGTVDLALDGHSISFSETTLYAGDVIRIYARVRNIGDTDASAHVLFYQGGMLVGKSQPVSLLANGNPDDVYVDFTVPTGSFNIRAVLQGSAPQDQNPVNDATMTPLYSPIVDADRDGVVDDEDSCPQHVNTDQLDTDLDGIGDVCDSDDDGDGVEDVHDSRPLDASTADDVAAPMVIVAPAAPTPSSGVSEPVLAPSQTPPVSPAEVPQADLSVDDTESDTTIAAISQLSTSPLARFTWKQTDWRTYEFTLAEQPEERVQFSWDFGDGATSVQPQILHAFSGPGTYTVTLAIMDDEGNMLSDAQTFDVTFFHLDNPQVIAIIVLLFIALFAFGFAFIRLRSSYDQGIAHK